MKSLFLCSNQSALYIFMLACLLLSQTTSADGKPGESRKELKGKMQIIDKSIKKLNKNNASNKKSSDNINAKLKKLKNSITNSSEKVTSLKNNILDIQNKIQQVTKQLSALNQQIANETSLLATHSQLAWQSLVSGRASILESDSISKQARIQTWSQYFIKSRTTAINNLSKNLQEQAKLVKHEQDAIQKLSDLQLQHAEATKQNKILQKENKMQLATLKNSIKENDTKISELKANQVALEKILKRLKLAKKDSAFQVKGKSFASYKGQLPWPANGSIRKPNIKKGVYISISKNTKVQAVAMGRVVYADRLQGYGLLLVIDHGDGYMSLYGQNGQIFANEGDWVDPGSIIASFGEASGKNKELYFEIRKDGSTLATAKWCKKRG